MENKTGQQYWDQLYQSRETRWDIGYPSPPLKEYIDQLEDKQQSILIPGCGNSYEAGYLLDKGFTNLTLIDISPSLTSSRSAYVQRVYELLKPGGKLVGVLFNRLFEEPGPPFGGTVEEYKELFKERFLIEIMELCYNSIEKRAGNEVFIKLIRTPVTD